MAVGFPTKVTYANGDVFSASDINDTNGTVNLINPTAKGSIVSASAANTPSRLAVGANNLFLRANSSATTGLEWAGTYTTFTPTYFALTVGNASVNTGRYLRIGNLVHVMQALTLGTTTSITGNVFSYFPIQANTANNGQALGRVRMIDTGTTSFIGNITQNSTDNYNVNANKASGNFVEEGGMNATTPMTWTSTDQLLIEYVYEVA